MKSVRFNKKLRKKIGERILKLRTEEGWSQRDLANRVNTFLTIKDCKQQSICGIETGRPGLSVETLFILAKALGVTTSTLIEGIEYEHTSQGSAIDYSI